MRPIATCLLALALAGCGAKAAEHALGGPIHITALPVPMDTAHPRASQQGQFTYAGGLELHGRDTDRLGGLSDIRVSPDGRLTAESDEGDLLRARLKLDSAWRLVGLDDVTLAALSGLDGKPLPDKAMADAEGLAIWPNGDRMVSFERHHRIWIYPKDGGPVREAPRPFIAMPANEGMEGLGLAPSRGPDAYWVGVEGGSIWLCHLSSGCERQVNQVQPPFPYRLTALSETPSGDLVVLHHLWNPLTRTSKIIVWITRPKPDGSVKIIDRLTLAPPFTVDNFEGVDAVTGPDGRLRLYLISDDNFSASQRTLLLAFDWAPQGTQR